MVFSLSHSHALVACSQLFPFSSFSLFTLLDFHLNLLFYSLPAIPFTVTSFIHLTLYYSSTFPASYHISSHSSLPALPSITPSSPHTCSFNTSSTCIRSPTMILQTLQHCFYLPVIIHFAQHLLHTPILTHTINTNPSCLPIQFKTPVKSPILTVPLAVPLLRPRPVHQYRQTPPKSVSASSLLFKLLSDHLTTTMEMLICVYRPPELQPLAQAPSMPTKYQPSIH